MGRRIRDMFAGVLMAFVVGCGRSPVSLEKVVPVSGAVKIEGKPAGDVRIGFIPSSKTLGRGGSAITNNDGNFEIVNMMNQDGIVPGTYQVVFSRRRMPDGTVPDESDPKSSMAAEETLDHRSNLDPKSPVPEPLTVSISEGGTTSLAFEVIPKK